MILKKIKQTFYALITVIVTVAIIDLVLHAAASISPDIDELTSFIPAKIPDPQLGHRGNPRYPDHDQKGFRNPSLPETAEIIALGDSQTYGSGVKADQAWPRVLEALSERPVYSMGLGGYGPAHSLILWDEAIALKPAVIIEAIYAGNDLHDSFSLVYNRGQLAELKHEDKGMAEAIMQAEAAEPIHERVSKMYRRGNKKSSLRLSIKSWLDKNSRVYGVLRRTQYELSRLQKRDLPPASAEDRWEDAQSFAAKHPQYTQLFNNQSLRTTFTSEYRLAALNLEDPRINEGKRLSLKVLERMHELADQAEIRFVVLFIPTKEMAFSKLASNLDSANYHKLIQNEQDFWEETKAFLDSRSIEYIDTLPQLQAELEQGVQIYKVSRDGHPNANGQKVIGELVHSYLATNNP